MCSVEGKKTVFVSGRFGVIGVFGFIGVFCFIGVFFASSLRRSLVKSRDPSFGSAATYRLFALARVSTILLYVVFRFFSAQNRKYCSISNIQTLEHSNTRTLEHSNTHLPMRRRILTPIAPAHTYTKVPNRHPIGLKPSLPSLLIRQNTRTLEHSNTHLPMRRRILTPIAPAHTYTDTSNRPQTEFTVTPHPSEHSNTRTLKHSPPIAPAHTPHPLRRRIPDTKVPNRHPIGLKPSLPSLLIRQNTRTLEHSNTHLPLRRRILTPIAPAHTYTDIYHSLLTTLFSLSLFSEKRERERIGCECLSVRVFECSDGWGVTVDSV